MLHTQSQEKICPKIVVPIREKLDPHSFAFWHCILCKELSIVQLKHELLHWLPEKNKIIIRFNTAGPGTAKNHQKLKAIWNTKLSLTCQNWHLWQSYQNTALIKYKSSRPISRSVSVKALAVCLFIQTQRGVIWYHSEPSEFPYSRNEKIDEIRKTLIFPKHFYLL